MLLKVGILLSAWMGACDLFTQKGGKPGDMDGDGYTSQQDCNDEDPSIHPNADEYCDDIDSDCDGQTTDSHALDATTWYADLDEDGYGDPFTEQRSCTAVANYVADATDCDDTTPQRSPAVLEICDGLDNDCDDEVDEEEDTWVIWYLDSDGDGYGTANDGIQSIASCDQPDGYVSNNSDCDDIDNAINPAAQEQWYDGVDQDCSGGSDADADADGFDHIDSGGDDCQDDDPEIHPEAEEICNDGIDNDCDGTPNACGVSGEVDLADASSIITGENNRDQIGNAIAPAGDLNGDGEMDLLIDARFSDDGGDNAGTVYVVLGPILTGESSVAEADAKIIGEAIDDNLGTVTAGIGDQNGDGYDDIVVTAVDNGNGGTSAGAVYLFNGPIEGTLYATEATARIYGDETYAQLGTAVIGVSELGSEGLHGLVLGVPGLSQTIGTTTTQPGGVALYLDTLTGEYAARDDADVIIVGEENVDYAGYAVSAGDINGDGFTDVLVSAPGHSGDETPGRGKMYVLLGPGLDYPTLADASWSITGLSTGDTLGSTINAEEDLNADGRDDLLIGASGVDDDAGAVYLFAGDATDALHTTAAEANVAYLGQHTGDRIGAVISHVGDLNGDDVLDLAFGAPAHSALEERAGATYIARATSTGTVELGDDSDAWILGEKRDDESGTSIAGLGDLDDDGYDDLLIGAPFHDSAGPNAGAVYLLRGGSL